MAGLIVIVIVGGGVVAGALAPSIAALLLYSCIVAIMLNALLLARVALAAGAWGKLPVALLGSAFAAIWDAAKVAAVGLIVYGAIRLYR